MTATATKRRRMIGNISAWRKTLKWLRHAWEQGAETQYATDKYCPLKSEDEMSVAIPKPMARKAK